MIKKTSSLAALLLAIAGVGAGQSNGRKVEPHGFGNEQDEAEIRSLLAYGFEETWNSHQPAAAVTPDKSFAEMIARLHAPGGPFHDHTRRHIVEDLRFIRPDVAIAVVKTFDIKRAGVPTTGEETRGLIVPSKENGRWKVNALENTKIQPVVSGQK
jgi:hypothetical protein